MSRNIYTSHTHTSGKPDGVALHYTCPTPEAVHWASPQGRPQHWYVKGHVPPRKRKSEREGERERKKKKEQSLPDFKGRPLFDVHTFEQEAQLLQ